MLAAMAAQRSSANCLKALIAQLACLRATCWRLSAERLSMSMVVLLNGIFACDTPLRAVDLAPTQCSHQDFRKACACDYTSEASGLRGQLSGSWQAGAGPDWCRTVDHPRRECR